MWHLLPRSLLDRIRVDPATGCWLFLGKWNSGNGYSKVSWEGRAWMVHRLVYTFVVGPIPEGLLLDHGCKNRSCCNPRHMEPVTTQVNTRRGNAVLFAPTRREGEGNPAD